MAHLGRIQSRDISPSPTCLRSIAWGEARTRAGVLACHARQSGTLCRPVCQKTPGAWRWEFLSFQDKVPALVPQQASTAREESSLGRQPSGGPPLPHLRVAGSRAAGRWTPTLVLCRLLTVPPKACGSVG